MVKGDIIKVIFFIAISFAIISFILSVNESISLTSITPQSGESITEIRVEYFDLELVDYSMFILNISNNSEGKKIKSIRLTGEVINDSAVEAYLIVEDKELLIYTNKVEHTPNPVTAFVTKIAKKIKEVNDGEKKEKSATPPGQDKKEESATPPGQEMKEEDGLPPGQEMKEEDGLPPGQEMKEEDGLPPGQEMKEEDGLPPGQEMKEEDGLPPGQEMKEEDGLPPGQEMKEERLIGDGKLKLKKINEKELEKMIKNENKAISWGNKSKAISWGNKSKVNDEEDNIIENTTENLNNTNLEDENFIEIMLDYITPEPIETIEGDINFESKCVETCRIKNPQQEYVIVIKMNSTNSLFKIKAIEYQLE